jgi:energy-coupling factor transport system permease protein
MYDLLYVPEGEPHSRWSFLYRLDPRSKVLFVAGVSLYLALVSSTGALLLALLALHLLALLSRGTRSRILSLWKGLWPLIATIVLLGSLRWHPADAVVSLGPIGVTLQAVWIAVGSGTRIAALTVAFSLLLWTTEPSDTVVGLTRLGLPFVVGLPAVIALQYVATFSRRFDQILEAQQSRGLALPRGNPVRIVRTYLPVLVPLIISALRSADHLALALQSRGFEAQGQRTYRRVLHMRARDWIFLLATAAVLGALSLV